MLRIKKKNTSGNAKNFITRTQAVKKLQVSLADFRRLCIFKGIYPREPRNKKKANKGSTAPVTFYYFKDIQYLLHEPILLKFREHKTFSKKLTKALGKGEINAATKLETNRPKYKLDSVIKERYPSFMDLIRDIDDALNMLFLFSNLPATDKITTKITKDADRLCNQWLMYVAQERLIKKVFVSIKGVYYSANVKGQEVIWLVPFKFPQNIPSDIDFRIMLTFLEFYSTLLNFVLFKLYNDANLQYPPKYDINILKKVGGMSSLIVESKNGNSILSSTVSEEDADVKETKLSNEEIAKAIEADAVVEDEEELEEDDENVENIELDVFQNTNKTSGDLLKQPSKYDNAVSDLFANMVFFVGREVPIDILEFLILSCGGTIIPEILIDESQRFDLSKVTHQISDRPKINNKVAGRTYVQPQWVFDSINKQTLLPVSDYAPGETLPPHLSPWGDSVGYDPEAEDDDEEESSESELEDAEDKEEEQEVDEDLQAQKELELEVKGIKFSDIDNNKVKLKTSKKVTTTKDEEKELAKIMMSNKQKKLYKKMQYGIESKQDKIDLLKKKKKLLQLKRELLK